MADGAARRSLGDPATVDGPPARPRGRGGDRGVVVGAACAVVIGLRTANDEAEPEGQNWWLVAWFVTGLAYSLAGVLL